MNNNSSNNPDAITVKKTQGRRKIAIKPIANQNSRHVTFSKRRLGIFKKASELCILCGVEIAIIVQSLKRQRLFTFGQPSVDVVIDRYLTGKLSLSPSPTSSSVMDHQFNFVQQNNEYYSQLCKELDAEKKKKENNNNNNGGRYWWNEPIDNMGIKELENFMGALEELKKNVNMKVDELSMINGSSSLPSTSTMNQALDYWTSIVPPDFNYPLNGQF
ncbi:unnamed protein product [Withania somnifera]